MGSNNNTSSANEQDALWADFVNQLAQDGPQDFREHWDRFQHIYAHRLPENGPPLAWQPDAAQMARSNLGRFMKDQGINNYVSLHEWSVKNPVAFFESAIETLGIEFNVKYRSIIGNTNDPESPSWLQGAIFNIVESCFKADPNKVAIITGDESSDVLVKTTYGELHTLVNKVANGLLEHGFSHDDGIALYMPMNLECVAAYLGIIKAGFRVISIADSYSPVELKRRMDITDARAIITVDSYTRGGRIIDLYDKVINAKAPMAIIIKDNDNTETTLRDGDILWKDFLSNNDTFGAKYMNADHIINILFSSGTTGDPKAIPWTQTTPIKCALDGYYHQDTQPNDVVAWPTNIGWMMGPWLIFNTLINNATIALFNGAPHSAAFVEFVNTSGITILGTIPSIVRHWKESLNIECGKWNNVRIFSSTGEPSSIQDYLWLMCLANYRAPIIEYCGGTEIGGAYITGSVMQPASPSCFTTAPLGISFVILDEKGGQVKQGEAGEVFIAPPSLGLSESLLNIDHHEVYYKGCPSGANGELLRRHGDYIEKLYNGFYKSQGRCDDSMNLGGIKISSLDLEQVINTHQAVYESAAISARRKNEGTDRLIVYIVMDTQLEADILIKQLNILLAKILNPLFKIHDLVITKQLPRTASFKLKRNDLRKDYIIE